MDPRSQFGKEPDLPFWAQGVKQQDYDNLLNAVRTYFRDHGNELEINEEKGVATPNLRPTHKQPLGLHNLIRVIPGMKPEDVQRHVFGHFGKVMVIKVEQQRLEGATFDEVKKHIRLRLFYTDPTNPADVHKGFPGIQLSGDPESVPNA